MNEYKILNTDGLAKRGRLSTVHGDIETPVFMNVGTLELIVIFYFAGMINSRIGSLVLEPLLKKIKCSGEWTLLIKRAL